MCGAMPDIANAVGHEMILVSAPGVDSTSVSAQARYGNKLEIVSRDQIDLAGPDADITRVLQMYVPGLYVSPRSGPFDYGNYSLLGGKNDDTLIMLDGVRLNNRLYGGIYLDTLPVTAIERIEVLKGAQSLAFGTQAVSGVINIVTRTPHSESVSGEMSGSVDSWGGRSGEALAENISKNLLGDLGWMFFLNRSKSDGYQPFRDSDLSGTVTDKWRGYDVTSVGGKLLQTFFDRARLELFWQYNKADLDYIRPDNNRKTRNDRVQNIVTTSWQDFPYDNFSYFIKGYLNDWDTQYTRITNQPDGGSRTLNDGDYWGFRDWGVQAEGQWRFWEEHELILGSDSQWYQGRDDVMAIDNQTASAQGFYTQFRPSFASMPHWSPAVGIRHEQMKGSERATVWMFSSSYELTDELRLRGQLGSAFKLPNAEQLYVNEPGQEMGNPDLQPEESRNAEAGLDYQPVWNNQALTLSATGYLRKISNLITLDGERWVNGSGDIMVRGVEISGALALTPQWKTHLDFNRNFIDASGPATANNIPAFFSRARMSFNNESERWGGELAARYVGSIKSAYGIDYGHYTVFDASAWYHLDAAGRHRVALFIENLFDKNYATGMTSNGLRQVDILGRPLTAELRYRWRF
ncbi:TonB-dependent receptor [Salmonella enterica]|nr:TonB-dependent receptor [Salmonella enterica]EAX6581617.1 TonB-dependent receptor [Salmonella enterica]